MSGLINIYDCLSIAVRLRLYSALDLCFRLYHDRCAASREIAFSLKNPFARWAATSSARPLNDFKLERALLGPYTNLQRVANLSSIAGWLRSTPFNFAAELLDQQEFILLISFTCARGPDRAAAVG